MSGQEPEDDSNRKRSGPSRGLALAATATAVGIGFGAAIYYMFKKREASEAANSTQPASAGATSADWTAEDQCALDDALPSRQLTTKASTSQPSTSKSVLSKIFTTRSGPFKKLTTKSGPIEISEAKRNPRPHFTNKSSPKKTLEAKSGPSQPSPSKSGPSKISEAKSGPSKISEANSGPSKISEAKSGPSKISESKSGPSQPSTSKSGPSRQVTKKGKMDSDTEYSTYSEHSTTDTSILEESDEEAITCIARDADSSSDTDHDISEIESAADTVNSEATAEEIPTESSELESSVASSSDDTGNASYLRDASNLTDPSYLTDYSSYVQTISSDESEAEEEWDVTTSSLDVPESGYRSASPLSISSVMGRFRAFLNSGRKGRRPISRENERRAREFRTRAWSAEECSICCEVMLDTHPLIDLDCSHRFHQECIRPWLRMEKPATCPNCRKRIEICELETIT